MATDEPADTPPPEMHIGAWFVGRMTDSIGDFAFLLTTGDLRRLPRSGRT
jgi:hypothetical protein